MSTYHRITPGQKLPFPCELATNSTSFVRFDKFYDSTELLDAGYVYWRPLPLTAPTCVPEGERGERIHELEIHERAQNMTHAQAAELERLRRAPAVLVADWAMTPPTEQGTYWHWNGDEDCAPLPMFVLWSGTTGKCFVSMGQLGIEHAIDCDQYGGWWMPLHHPPFGRAARHAPKPDVAAGVRTSDASLPPLSNGPKRDMVVKIRVSEDFEKRLDNQWEVEREIHADRWGWEWASDYVEPYKEKIEFLEHQNTQQAVEAEAADTPGDGKDSKTIQGVREILAGAPELNMCNYDHQQVRDLNDAMIQAVQFIDAALSAAANTQGEK